MVIKDYKVALYLRLSRDDTNSSLESMSISNQREMLASYANEKGWRIVDVYADDGFSGTTFDRPEFQRMIGDILKGKINVVITKDLSRLGRNYVKVGEYTDFFFPKHKVRYISVTENIDSDRENDIAGFLNIVNEHYAKDISRKVKAVKSAKIKKGKFIGSYPPYGYKKSPEDRNQLIIDDFAAEVVRRIFTLFASGESGRRIAEVLNSEGVLTPSVYYYDRIGKPYPYNKNNKQWGSSTIMTMMRSVVYIGHMAQGKRKNASFKMKYRESVPKENWVIVENTHDPIIDDDLWEKVQNRLDQNKHVRAKKDHTISIFSGVVRCADCGCKLVHTTKTYGSKSYELYRCSTYSNNGHTACTNHMIYTHELEQLVIEDIKKYASIALRDEKSLLQRIRQVKNQHDEEKSKVLNNRIQKCEKAHEKIDNLMKMLFDEKLSGTVSDELFARMISDYEGEQKEIRSRLHQLHAELDEVNDNKASLHSFVELIKDYICIEKLDNRIVKELIESITVSETYIRDGQKHQDITIKYNLVGQLDQLSIVSPKDRKKVIDQKLIEGIDNRNLSIQTS